VFNEFLKITHHYSPHVEIVFFNKKFQRTVESNSTGLHVEFDSTVRFQHKNIIYFNMKN